MRLHSLRHMCVRSRKHAPRFLHRQHTRHGVDSGCFKDNTRQRTGMVMGWRTAQFADSFPCCPAVPNIGSCPPCQLPLPQSSSGSQHRRTHWNPHLVQVSCTFGTSCMQSSPVLCLGHWQYPISSLHTPATAGAIARCQTHGTTSCKSAGVEPAARIAPKASAALDSAGMWVHVDPQPSCPLASQRAPHHAWRSPACTCCLWLLPAAAAAPGSPAPAAVDAMPSTGHARADWRQQLHPDRSPTRGSPPVHTINMSRRAVLHACQPGCLGWRSLALQLDPPALRGRIAPSITTATERVCRCEQLYPSPCSPCA